MFQQCQQGKLTDVREQINQLILKKSAGRAKATPAKTPDDDDDDEECEDEEVQCVFLYTVSHKSEYSPHISTNILIFSRDNAIEIKRGYILEWSMCCFYSITYLLSSENNSTYSHYC